MIIDNINKFRSDGVAKYQRGISCYAPFQSMHINKKGRIKPCPFSMQFPYGKDQIQWGLNKSLKECWDDAVYEDMRDEVSVGSLHKGYCNYCVEQCEQGKPPSSLDYDHVGGERSLNHEYPKEIELELSNKCNYMCDACSPWCSSEWAKQLGLEKDTHFHSIFDDKLYMEALVNDLRTFIHEVHRINFTGGEPFAQPAVYAILKMIEEENANVGLHFTTNGSVMNSAVKRMAKRPNTRFTVSLDSIDPIAYPTIRVNGILSKVMKNIDYLVETNKNTIGASFVVTKKNVLELPSILSWCNNKGIEFSYHILENMGFRDWENELKPMLSIEHEDKLYLKSLKKYLIDARDSITKNNDKELYDRNMFMYEQYIERLK